MCGTNAIECDKQTANKIGVCRFVYFVFTKLRFKCIQVLFFLSQFFKTMKITAAQIISVLLLILCLWDGVCSFFYYLSVVQVLHGQPRVALSQTLPRKATVGQGELQAGGRQKR